MTAHVLTKDKSERALILREQGLAPPQIAERLGSNPRAVCAMILKAKKRREKAAGEVVG